MPANHPAQTTETHRLIASPANHGVWVFVLLAASMAATRYHHFSSALHVADTSWAVFFLAGLWLRSRWGLPALLLLALGIDLASVAIDGAAMSACFTPAYPGLVLAYGALWLAGRWAARFTATDSMPTATLSRIGWATVGTLAAFAVSNITFWAFSGHFGNLGLMDYSSRVLLYLSHYVQTTSGYVLTGLVIAALWQAIAPTQGKASATAP